MVHEQRQDSDKKYEELRGEFTLSIVQVQSMMETIRVLTAEVAALNEDVDKKGGEEEENTCESSIIKSSSSF